MRRMREDRRILGASADLPGMMRRHALLRQLAEPSRQPTRASERTPCDCVSAARRALAILLS